jgi:acyl-CoA thioesterase-2
MRVAGASTDLRRPPSFSCLFLGVGEFDDVDVRVTSPRRAKRAEAMRVSIEQGDRLLLEAQVWAVADDLAGLEHDVTVAPDVAGPGELRSVAELMAGQDPPPFNFWRNFDRKPLRWIPPEEWPPPPPLEPRLEEWMRFAPTARFDDPWVDACRAVVLLDTMQWPAASRTHLHRPAEAPAYIAPSMDLSVRFHRPAPESEWLLIEAEGPLGDGGLLAGTARVWDEQRRLVATAASQMLCREVPRGTPGSGTTA